MGGLARRASSIREVRSHQAERMLFLSAGNELLSPDEPASAQIGKGLVKAYSALRYDFGILTPKESNFITEVAGSTPTGFVTIGAAPKTAIIPVAGKKVGVIGFPEIKDQTDEGLSKIFQLVSETTETLKKKADLVIGLSTWGITTDDKYIHHPEISYVDVLLGSGQGIGILGSQSENGKIILSRLYKKGKAIQAIDIFNWPARSTDFQWVINNDYSYRAIALKSNFASAQDIESFFQ